MDTCQPGQICTLDRDEMGDRVRAWISLNRASLASQSRDDQGLTLVYRRSEQSEQALDELVRLEHICCSEGGIQFSLSKQKKTLTLRVTLSKDIQQQPEASEILNALASI